MIVKGKILGILAVLYFLTIVIFLVSRPVTGENEQPAFEYTVQAGDTCGKIAVGLSVSILSIVEANNLKRDCSNIHVGQVLLIPYPTPTPLSSPITTFRAVVIDCEHEIYTVKDGDTLDTIANKYKTPKQIISDSNGLVDDHVETGMQLIIDLCYPTFSP